MLNRTQLNEYSLKMKMLERWLTYDTVSGSDSIIFSQMSELITMIHHVFVCWARILVQVTINRRLLIGRDGHLDQSEAYDLSKRVR